MAGGSLGAFRGKGGGGLGESAQHQTGPGLPPAGLGQSGGVLGGPVFIVIAGICKMHRKAGEGARASGGGSAGVPTWQRFGAGGKVLANDGDV